jgi:hypothetical protein
MSDIFWNSPTLEPKRDFKFLLIIRGVPSFVVKVAGRPKFSIEAQPHRYLGKEFWFPGTVTWEPVSATLVEPIQKNSVAIMRDIIAASGYDWMRSNSEINSSQLGTVSKKAAVTAMGNVVLLHIDSEGNTVDRWKLMNSWISDIEPSELSYDSEDLSNLVITLRYDYAIVETPGSENTLASVSNLIGGA